MKILIANDSLTRYGGAEKAVFDVKKLLEENNHSVFLIGEDNHKETLTSFFKRWFNLKYYFKTKKLIKNNNVDVLHIHDCTLSISPSPIIAARKVNRRVVMTVHSFYYYCPRTWSIDKNYKACQKGYGFMCLFSNCPTWQSMKAKPFFLFLKWLKVGFYRFLIEKYVDHFICPSREIKKFMQRTFNLPEEKITYLPNFIKVPNNYETKFSKVKNNQFLFVGRISEEKGISIAIKAISILIKENIKDINLKIIGSGNEKNNLENLVKKLNLENNIKFLGKIDNDKLYKYYQESIAVLMPSIWLENNPLVALESMKNSRPIIASDTGGYPDLIEHGKNGYLFEAGNYQEMSRYIKTLYGNTELSKKLGEYGFEKVKREFSEKLYYKKLLKIYS